MFRSLDFLKSAGEHTPPKKYVAVLVGANLASAAPGRACMVHTRRDGHTSIESWEVQSPSGDGEFVCNADRRSQRTYKGVCFGSIGSGELKRHVWLASARHKSRKKARK